MKKYYAVLTRWDNKKEVFEIQKEWIDDIVCAVSGQLLLRVGAFSIAGNEFSHVDIVEV